MRPWCVQDVPALVKAYRDPALRRWTRSSVDDDAGAVLWVRARQHGWAEGDRFAFAVLEAQPRSDEQPIGHVVVREVAHGKPSAEVGYWTAAHARGRGVASRALEVLTDWAFETLAPGGLERLELLHQADNVASCRVARTCGYELTGALPAAPPAFPLDGHVHARSRAA
ncbi:MAG: GNAT family N-acetyltransferase [Cellulomonas sp. 73-145]|nr:MAG: GNAT family N-acetyltransferase [Cellulomonas sp. 73-145]